MFRSLRKWWQIKTGRVDTPFDGEVPFWVVSLGFHLLIIILLAGVIMPPEESPEVRLTLEEVIEEELTEDELPPEIEFDELMTEDIGADGEEGFETAASQAPIIDVINEDPIDLDMKMRDHGELVTDDDMLEASAEEFSSVAVKGSVGQSVKAASGAVDRITQEILMSMEERETVVVWLFDQSASLMEQREEILNRFDRVYKELGMIQASGHQSFESASGPPLLTQVYAFGSRVKPLLRKPTESLSMIKEAIEGIQRDRSGIENVMEAVIMAANQHDQYRKIDRTTGQPKRNVMIIVVSDEAGDDVKRVDEAIKVCNRNQMPVYVIGVPAPFGRSETKVKWVDPDPQFDQDAQWAIVKQGPESVFPERLRLDFSGTFDDLDMIDSGFGPFHLTRLTYETSGIYFAVHPNRNTKRRVRQWQTKSYSSHLQYFFDPIAMRKYKPDYVSTRTYYERLKSNPAREALVEASRYTTTGTLESPVLRFPKLNEATFVNQVSRAQQSAAFVMPELEKLYQILKRGEEARETEISPRWKAGFDLAMGRALAAKIRAKTYNSMLGMAKTKLKFDPAKPDLPQNNTWILKPADSTQTGSQDAKLLAKAKLYLNRVVEEHKDTPWEMLAQRELSTPIGWKWTQSYTAPPQPRQRRPNNNNNNNRPNMPRGPRMNAQPKIKRPPPKL